jgi:hypothetical protein
MAAHCGPIPGSVDISMIPVALRFQIIVIDREET